VGTGIAFAAARCAPWLRSTGVTGERAGFALCDGCGVPPEPDDLHLFYIGFNEDSRDESLHVPTGRHA
jgi:hypothetical protein